MVNVGRKNAYQKIKPSMGEAAGGYMGIGRAGACPTRAVVMEGTNMAHLSSPALPRAPPSLWLPSVAALKEANEVSQHRAAI